MGNKAKKRESYSDAETSIHALTWCQETASYIIRDPEHYYTLTAIFGDILTLTPENQEWFGWLASISSFAFLGREGRFTARCETKQHGERYWIAYQRTLGILLYLQQRMGKDYHTE